MPREVCDQWVSGKGRGRGDKLESGVGCMEIGGQ